MWPSNTNGIAILFRKLATSSEILVTITQFSVALASRKAQFRNQFISIFFDFLHDEMAVVITQVLKENWDYIG